MNKEFKTPPPFVQCDNCLDGIDKIQVSGAVVKCLKCAHSPLPGWLPQWYTPEQWVEYVRRENNMPDYEIPGERSVWYFIDSNFIQWEYGSKPKTDKWIGPIQYKGVLPFASYVVIHTDAGRPPKDWRPE